MKQHVLFFIFILFLSLMGSISLNAQHDSLVFKNKNIIVGEIKSLKNGLLTIETVYSDKDFVIEWYGISELFSKTRFLLTLKDGTRLTGYINTDSSSKKLKIVEDDDSQLLTTLEDLVYLKGLKTNFWSRTKASIDLGINIIKANNLRQFNLGSKAGYSADKWTSDFFLNINNSNQDSVDATKRTEAGLNFVYFLQHGMFFSSSLNFLSNTEQALRLRTTGKAGLGKFLIQTNRAYWGAGGGFSFNNESFVNETEARNSLELYVASEVKLFDIGDLNLYGNWAVYRGITKSGRWRSDLKLDVKYDLPLDFYVKCNYTVNYDNKPAIPGNDFDYIFGFSFGWEL
jgi:Protein of unknown function, DUF481